ncbi:hypothetical protein UlMin_011872 [Ulmus minor]
MDSDAEEANYQSMEALEATRVHPDLSSPSKKKKKKKKKKGKEKEKEASPVQATIQVFQDNPEKAPPLIGYFPSGFEPKPEGDEAEPNPTMVRVFRNREKPKRLQLVVSPSGSNVDFVGTNYTGEAEAGQQHCNYALGVLDKETQTLKILPIASNKIFRLEPKVGGLDFANKEPANFANGELSEQNKRQRLNELTKRYSTKKSIKEAKKLHALMEEDRPETKRDLEAQIKQIVIKKEAFETTEVQNARNIPPYNADATSPQEAYPLEKIIFKGEWGFLEDIYQLLQEEAEVSWDAYPSFISNRILKLEGIQDEEEKKRLSCIFSFIMHLIKFKDQYSMDGVSSAKRHKIPSILRQKFSTMFSDPESKKLSAEKNDLLISYVLVLTLWSDEFETNVTDIAKDLRMNSTTVRMHYEHLGCKISRHNNLLYATLPIPLNFQQLSQKRRRR